MVCWSDIRLMPLPCIHKREEHLYDTQCKGGATVNCSACAIAVDTITLRATSPHFTSRERVLLGPIFDGLLPQHMFANTSCCALEAEVGARLPSMAAVRRAKLRKTRQGNMHTRAHMLGILQRMSDSEQCPAMACGGKRERTISTCMPTLGVLYMRISAQDRSPLQACSPRVCHRCTNRTRDTANATASLRTFSQTCRRWL